MNFITKTLKACPTLGMTFASILISTAVDAAPMPIETKSSSSAAYASIQYYGDFFTNMGDFSGKEDAAVNLADINSYSKSGAAITGYDPKYKTDYVAGGISLGYSIGGARIELEGQYSKIEVDSEGFSVKDGAKFVELRRDDKLGDSATSNATTGINPSGNMLKNLQNAASIIDLQNWAGSTTTSKVKDTDHLATRFSNDGIRFIGGFVNVGYDVPVSAMPISPFVVAGIGFAQTKFFGQTEYGLAYQGKIGVAYNITDSFNIFVAYDYRGSFVKEYKEVVPANTIVATPKGGNANTPPVEAVVASKTATIETTFGVHGLMAGLSMKF